MEAEALRRDDADLIVGDSELMRSVEQWVDMERGLSRLVNELAKSQV
jgi:hypothetical protein